MQDNLQAHRKHLRIYAQLESKEQGKQGTSIKS